MGLGWNVETYISLTGIIISTIISILIIKINWRQYGLLFVISGLVGTLLCYLFIEVGFYIYPYRFFPKLTKMPFTLVLTMFPFYVLFGVRFSPKAWSYKIPFYWVMVHIGVFGEVLSQTFTQIIKYQGYWDTWDSYTWWWLFLIIFEFVGGTIVSQENRKPIDESNFKYGKLGWIILHFTLISTIFMAGFYMGKVT